MNGLRRSLLVALAGLLGACTAVTPAPESAREVPSTWAIAQSAAETGADLTQWWQAFGDPLLDRLVDAALAGNPDLAAARARLRAARAGADVAAAGLGPAVGASASVGARRDDQQTERFRQQDATQSFVETGLDARWELDVFGGLRAAREAAADEAAAGAFAAETVRVTLVAEIAREYFSLRGAQARLAVAERNIALQREALALLASRARAGLASQLDVAKATTDLAQLRAARAPFHDAIAQARLQLAVLTGVAPARLADPLATPAPLPESLPTHGADLPSAVLERRPDLRQARAAVLAAHARVGVARADLLPKFYLSGLLATGGETGPQLRLGPGLVFSLAPSVRLPLFTAGRLRAQVRARDAELDTALAQYDATLLNALREVESAASSLAQQELRRTELSRARDSAERARALALSRQQSGVDDYFAVIDAQRVLYASEDQLAASATARVLHGVALCKALGGGWDVAAVAAR